MGVNASFFPKSRHAPWVQVPPNARNVRDCGDRMRAFAMVIM